MKSQKTLPIDPSAPLGVALHAVVGTRLTHTIQREVEELARRMDDPQDLNDAMLSVARDNAVTDIMGRIERKLEADIMAAMGIPPTIEVKAEVSEARWSPNS
jgi:hypothetical protein